MKPLIRMAGLFLLLCGLGAAVYFFAFFDVSVETPSGMRVANLGLMGDRQNGIIFGFGTAIVGGILVVVGSLSAKPPEPHVVAPVRPAGFRPPQQSGPTWKSAKEIESDIDWNKF